MTPMCFRCKFVTLQYKLACAWYWVFKIRVRYRSLLKTNFIILCTRTESVNLVQQRHSSGNPASNTREYARPLRYYRFKVKRISRTWQSGLSERVESSRRAPLCGRVPLYLRRPNGRLAQLTDSDILISPGYQRLTYFPDPIKTASSVEIKSLRHPSVRVSSTSRWRSGAEKRFMPQM